MYPELARTALPSDAIWHPELEYQQAGKKYPLALFGTKHVLDLNEQLKANEQKLDKLVKVSEAAPLIEETGFRAATAAKFLVAWSHDGRVRSEGAFACLAGVNPIPASSGNTVSHRLNRGWGQKAQQHLAHCCGQQDDP
jgi:transposase